MYVEMAGEELPLRSMGLALRQRHEETAARREALMARLVEQGVVNAEGRPVDGAGKVVLPFGPYELPDEYDDVEVRIRTLPEGELSSLTKQMWDEKASEEDRTAARDALVRAAITEVRGLEDGAGRPLVVGGRGAQLADADVALLRAAGRRFFDQLAGLAVTFQYLEGEEKKACGQRRCSTLATTSSTASAAGQLSGPRRDATAEGCPSTPEPLTRLAPVPGGLSSTGRGSDGPSGSTRNAGAA